MVNSCSALRTKMQGITFKTSVCEEPLKKTLVTLGHIPVFQWPGEEWGEQEKETCPYRQVPVLYIDGAPMAQTKAVLRYLGRVTQFQGKFLYPSDPYVAAKVDEQMDSFDDLWILLAPTYRIQNQVQKEQARQRLFEEGEARFLIDIFEKTLEKSTNGFVIAEAGFSVADLMFFGFLAAVGVPEEGLGPKLLSGYPNILKHKEMVAAIPEVQKYYKKQNNAAGQRKVYGRPIEASLPPGLLRKNAEWLRSTAVAEALKTTSAMAPIYLGNFISPALGLVEPLDGSHASETAHGVSWDEANLAEHDKERGTRRKIDEPKTPWAQSPVSSEDEGAKSPDGPKAALDAAAQVARTSSELNLILAPLDWRSAD
ncbi:unnamed protein product [Cladocopium goreaui]|uniref:Glutathione S-transferase 1 (GST class-sigma) n=1 Tax=Cladocopium goreaui TaxID=2562237 RepID=A0A9P1BKH3_9DINO|nr:unnamed protein product [Cladocopium goreaui]